MSRRPDRGATRVPRGTWPAARWRRGRGRPIRIRPHPSGRSDRPRRRTFETFKTMTALAQSMSPATLLASTIAKKVVMALTGLALFGFTALHIASHFLMFKDPAEYNAYAHMLQTNPPVLW